MFGHLSSYLVLAFVLPFGCGAIRAAPAGSSTLDGLDATALGVESELLSGQSPAGYWETQFTSGPRFDRPATEVNTFVPALIVVLLDPVTSAGPLRQALDRAKADLADQVEGDGTVRYYGRPGSAITADADDTSLVWAMAPNSAASLALALKRLKANQTPDGLYRTWLAPAKDLVGVNPGRDPNPPDLGIQLDVLCLLGKVDKSAAGKLWAAVANRGGDLDLWVYYRMTPLLPNLRADELRRMGYPVVIPPERRRALVGGQEDWVRSCELIGLLDMGRPDPDLVQEARALLARQAKGIRLHPPLFYHNDLSASVARYYWSADFGDAIWLRLYAELKARDARGSR